MTFEERLRRNDIEDKIEIGNIVDNAIRGDFGYLLRAVVNGIIDRELQSSRKDFSIPPERVLGRIESLNQLMEELDIMVDVKNQLTQEKKESTQIKSGEDPKV